MIQNNKNISEDMNYRIDQIKEDSITIVANNNTNSIDDDTDNNTNRIKKIILHYKTQTEDQKMQIKDDLNEQKIFDDFVWVNLDEKWKVPSKILNRLPNNLLIKKIVETIYVIGGEVTDIRKIRTVK